MANPLLDQDRADFVAARTVAGRAQVSAWPRPDKELDVDPRSVSQSARCGWRGSCGRGRCVVVGCCSS